MRDIRGDLQDRASLLEEEIEAAEAKFEKLIAQLRKEHDDKLEELTTELDVVNRLMDIERRRGASTESEPEIEHRQSEPEAEPYRPARSEQEVGRRRAPAMGDRRAPKMEPRRASEMAPRRAPEMEDRRSAQEVEYRRLASMVTAPEAPPRTQQPLADFIIRVLSEVGTVSRDDLCHFALREGYFDDGDSAIRAVYATLVDLAKSDRIQQLPDGMFAPASLSQTLRLRRAM